jgi:hypothetical protein
MYSLFENLLAARDDNAWVQFIIIAVIIGFSVLKTIVRSIKAAAEQKSGQSKYSPTPAKPKKRYVAADGSYKTLEQLREERITQIRAAFGIPQPPAEQEPAAAETLQIAEKIEKPPAPPAPEPQKVYAEPAPSKVPASKIGSKPTKVSTDKQTVSETVYQLPFSAPQDLRTAILYYEILGKPLALRDT